VDPLEISPPLLLEEWCITQAQIEANYSNNYKAKKADALQYAKADIIIG